VEAGDVSGLTSALRLYLRDAELRQRSGRAGREHVLLHFRREVIWEALYEEYDRLLRENGSVTEDVNEESANDERVSLVARRLRA
jgi:hypothetical protein